MSPQAEQRSLGSRHPSRLKPPETQNPLGEALVVKLRRAQRRMLTRGPTEVVGFQGSGVGVEGIWG